MNILKKIHNSPKLKRIKSKRAKLQAQLKKLGRSYKSTFKSEARRMRKKGSAHKGHTRKVLAHKGHRRK